MKNLILLIALTVFSGGLQAQESIASSGGEASGAGGTVSYSVGQVSYRVHTGTTGSVTEGVQQPYEFSVVIGIEESGINLQFIAYPNPVSDQLILRIADETFTGNARWLASLYNMEGSMIKQQIIGSRETTIDMSDVQSASYLLKITNDNREVKTFKIIKTQ